MSSESLERYKRLLERHQELEDAGRGESEESDRLCSEADPVWLDLTGSERDEARRYSSELWRRGKGRAIGEALAAMAALQGESDTPIEVSP